jgi:asparagine synthase (glutamine-hydrolysing)
MPGVFGIVDWSATQSVDSRRELMELVRRMSSAMMYGDYSEQIVLCPAVGACVGQAELRQPSCRPEGEDVVVFVTGERAPDLDLGSLTSLPGTSLVAATKGSQSAFPMAVDGRCAGFVADNRARVCAVFNDRYGRERMFVHSDGVRTYFASEVKAILAAVPGTRQFDAAGLAEFLACGCTRGTRSLYRGIEILEPGTLLFFTSAGARRRRYFKPQDLEELQPVSAAEFLESFRESLRNAVRSSPSTARKLGVSLTGGLDSRMVIASLDAPPDSIACYTFGSMFRTTGDVAVAQAVARSCGQPHQVISLDGEFLSRIRETLDESVYASDGYLGLSGAAELYVNRQALSLAPIRMTGNWGGELMRGVRAFKSSRPRGGFIRPDLDAQIAVSARDFARTDKHPISTALFDQIPNQGYGRYAIERSQLTVRSPFLADDVVTSLYRAPASVRASHAAAAAVVGRRPALLAIPTDQGSLGRRPSRFRRVWRRTLIKAEYLTSHGAPDWLATLGARLPSGLLEIRFLGIDKFQHFRYWSRRSLAEFVRETLTSDTDALANWFDMRRVASMVDDHVAGRANYMDEIDRLLTLATATRVLFRRFEAAS